MSSIIHLRVRRHPVLGDAIQTKPDGDWWVFLRSTGRPFEHPRTDKFVYRDGWVEVPVGTPGE